MGEASKRRREVSCGSEGLPGEDTQGPWGRRAGRWWLSGGPCGLWAWPGLL